VDEPISVRARFERFPATVKGAFIFRGEDADPHQVVVSEARVAAVGGGGSSPLPMTPVTLDVVPHRDVFVPFEFAVTELEPGWYTLVCDVEVDGASSTYDGGSRFSVAWPRATIRRGSINVDERVPVGGVVVHVDQLECSGDSIRLSLQVDPPSEVGVKLSADGRRVQVLDVEIDDTTGKGRVTAYPLLRADEVLRIGLKGRGRGADATLDVPLP
jgi:hypothetical protein